MCEPAAAAAGRRDSEDRDTARCPVLCVYGLRDQLRNQIVVGLVATLGATGMVEASAARSASIPFGAPCEPPTAHESWGTAHRHRRGRVAMGRQIRRDHVCELVILDCGAGHNFELELSERRIAADLAGQLHPSSIRRASLVPGQEVAVDLRLLAGLWLRRVRVPRESGLATAAASPIVPRSAVFRRHQSARRRGGSRAGSCRPQLPDGGPAVAPE